MLQGTIDNPAPLATARSQRWSTLAVLLTGVSALLALVAVCGWMNSTQIADLGSVQQMRSHGVYADWDQGSVIVLVRHAERCDRSQGACLNDPAGITVAGSQVAGSVGNGLRRLGLADVDLLASPEVRTRQTAHYLFGKEIATEDWLARCNADFADAALARKRPGHNLVLVTHSGCIDQLERSLGVASDQRTPGYASALLVSLGGNGKAKVLGQMNAGQWRKLDTGKKT